MRRIRIFLALALCAVVALGLAATIAYSADGDLDPTFEGDGLITTNFHDTLDEAHAVAIQPDGKIVVVGTTAIPNHGNNFSVARYNPNGSPDASFGFGDGRLTTDIFGGYDDSANAVAIQPDGKIVVAGTSCITTYSFCDFAVVRYLPDGNLDTNFALDGITMFWVEYEYNAAFGVALQDDGKIVVAGYTNSADTPADFSLARLNADGSFDTSFSGDGKLHTNFFGGVDEGRGVVIQPDGKIVVAGNAQVNGSNYDFAVARYLSNGDLDNDFDSDGKVTTDFFGGDDGAYAVTLHPDGYIVVAGGFYSAGQGYDFGLARYFPTGELDTSFDGDGVLDISFADGTATEVALGVTIQPSDGKVVAVGYAPVQGVNNFALVRLIADGSLDPTFGNGGKVTHNFGVGDATAHGVAIQPDGKIVAAGGAFMGNTNDVDFALARYMLGDLPAPTPTPAPLTFQHYLPLAIK